VTYELKSLSLVLPTCGDEYQARPICRKILPVSLITVDQPR
jgi:hypothetical protein